MFRCFHSCDGHVDCISMAWGMVRRCMWIPDIITEFDSLAVVLGCELEVR